MQHIGHNISFGKKSICVLAIVVVSGLTSCAVGPDFMRPELPFSQAFDARTRYISLPLEKDKVSDEAVSVEITERKAPAALEKFQTMSRWWEQIDDPLLNEYVKRIATHNLSLAEAAARVLQAKEAVAVEQGGLFPSLTAGASASRRAQSSVAGSAGVSAGASRIFSTQHDLNLQTSWELDLFGRVRRSVESSQASFKATIFDQEALTHTLIAQLLRHRIAIAVLWRTVSLAKENAKAQEEIYALVARRYSLGHQETSLADVYLAQETLSSIKADIHSFSRQLTEQAYQLDVLLGYLPGTIEPNVTSFPLIPPPQTIVLCMPASLLDRRPDLKASELRIRAANANVGVAIADMYPGLSLTGALGFSGNGSNQLLTADRLAGSLLASITQPLFAGGSLRAKMRVSKARVKELSAAYAQKVLEAVKEVETALMAEESRRRELKDLSVAYESLLKAESVTLKRYKDGISTLRQMLQTQQQRYQVEQKWLNAQQNRWNERINLYLALGGDWDVEKENSADNQKVINGCS